MAHRDYFEIPGYIHTHACSLYLRKLFNYIHDSCVQVEQQRTDS